VVEPGADSTGGPERRDGGLWLYDCVSLEGDYGRPMYVTAPPSVLRLGAGVHCETNGVRIRPSCTPGQAGFDHSAHDVHTAKGDH
jgi:hypothetical protein